MQWARAARRSISCLAFAAVVLGARALPAQTARPAVRWNEDWPRFSIAEAMVSVAVTFRNADLGGALDGPESAMIKFEVPVLDHGTRSLLRGSESQRRGAVRLSDLTFRSMALAPYAVDIAFGALILHRNLDVAAQLALIDFEVLTLAGLTQILGSRVIGRARPYVSECESNGGCFGGPYRSFLSGHTMGSFAAAGLMCRHHQMLPLFGGGAPDTWACVWAVTAASVTGTLRLIADEHWASDIILGAGVGWLYGYYLPKLLHFHTKKAVATTADGGRRSFTWLPTFAGTPDGATLGVLGTF
jgi:membrane-associated phospholipid phosphatase